MLLVYLLAHLTPGQCMALVRPRPCPADAVHSPRTALGYDPAIIAPGVMQTLANTKKTPKSFKSSEEPATQTTSDYAQATHTHTHTHTIDTRQAWRTVGARCEFS